MNDHEFRDRVLSWMTEEINNGSPPTDAAIGVLGRIKRDGYVEEFAAEFGARSILDAWRLSQHTLRSGAFVDLDGFPKVRPSAAIGYESIFGIFENVGGRYIRRGDMTAQDCATKAAEYRKLAGANEAFARAWETVARQMKSGKARTVRDAFAGAKIKRFKAIFKKVGAE